MGAPGTSARRPPPAAVLLLVIVFVMAAALPLLARAAHAPRGPAAFLLRPTAAAARRQRWTRAATASSSSGARDFFVEIEDATLPPGSPPRKVHVLDTGAPQHEHQPPHPPLVLIGGTAQVINSWVGHTSAFARDRRFVIVEARGQGKTTLDLAGASMATHVEDLRRVCDALGLTAQQAPPIDLAGFSFGGRVALAATAAHPGLVRRLVLTGVPADRDAQGRLILKAWRASLERGNLAEFAWSSMLQCHAPPFLTKYEAKIPEWVDFVVKNNRAEGILSIVTKSHTTDPADPFHTLQLARRVQCPTLLLGGEADRVAAAAEIQRLAVEAGKGWPVALLPGTGHNCVFEDPNAWRRHVLEFLS